MSSLLTIVFTDVVESSATKRDVSLGRDSRERDRAYLEKVQARHFSLIRDCSKAHGGREVSTMGDAFYLVFDDPVAAVRCAADIQRRLTTEPIETPRGPLRLRIGIHSGYPEFFEGSYHGTDVDKAARVEGVATEQQILLSSTTYELVEHMADIEFRRQGEFALKGVGRVTLWEADWDGKGPRPTAVPPLDIQRRKKRTKLALATLAAALALAAALGYRYYLMHRAEELGRALHGPVKTRRSVAVLGFKNLGKPEAGWLSTALSEMLSTELAAGGQLRTIPGENVARMKNDLSLPDAGSYVPETLARIRGHLGADDLVLGSYLDLGKEAGGQIRLDVCSQDTISGETLCKVAETGTESDLFHLVDKAGAELRRSLGAGGLSLAEAANARAALPSNPEAARLYTEGLEKLRLFDALGARDLIEKAIALEPNYPLAHSALAEAWSKLGYDENAKEEAKKAFDLSSNLSREDQLVIQGRYREAAHQPDKAIEAYRTLYDFFPDNLDYGLRLAAAQTRAGKGNNALTTVEALRKLSPRARDDPRVDLTEADAAYSLGDFAREQAAATRAAEKAAALGASLLVAEAQLDQCWALRGRGRYKEARTACENAKATYARSGNRDGAAVALLRGGVVLADQGDLAGAESAYEQALAVFRQVGDQARMAATLNNLGNLLSNEGDHEGAARRYEQSLAVSRAAERRLEEGLALGNLAVQLKIEGKLDAAKARFSEALAVNHEIGKQDSEAIDLAGLGNTLCLQGELSQAEKALDKALAICRRIGSKQICGWTLFFLGDVLTWEGNLDQARAKYLESLAIEQEIGDQVDAIAPRVSLAELLIEEGHAGDAEPALREAREALVKQQDVEDEIWTDADLARALLAQGKPVEARAEVDAASERVTKIHDRKTRLKLAIVIGTVRAASGKSADQDAAAKGLEAALAEATKYGFVGYQYEARLALGGIEMKSGHTAAGRARLATLRKEAAAKGFGLIARKAAALTGGT